MPCEQLFRSNRYKDVNDDKGHDGLPLGPSITEKIIYLVKGVYIGGSSVSRCFQKMCYQKAFCVSIK